MVNGFIKNDITLPEYIIRGQTSTQPYTSEISGLSFLAFWQS